MNWSNLKKLLLVFCTSLLIFASYGTYLHAEDAMAKKYMALGWDKQSKVEKIVKTERINARKKYDYQKIKAQLDKQPEGYRSLLVFGLHKELFRSKRDFIKAENGQMVRGIWHDYSVQVTKENYDEFFRNLKEIGAKVDYLVVDIERGNGYWKFPKETRNLSLKAIAQDPRFKSEGWDKKLGISDPEALTKAKNRYKFSEIMHEYTGELIEEAVFEPVKKHYPDIILGNYEYGNASTEFPAYDVQGHKIGKYQAPKHIGNRSVPVAYGRINNIATKKFDGRREFGNSPFASLMLSVNLVRTSYLTEPSVPITPWVAWSRFGAKTDNLEKFINRVPMADTDYYNESIYHIALTGVDTFLYWNPPAWKEGQPKEQGTLVKDERLMNRLLLQLDDIVGYQDVVPIVDDTVDPYARYIMTGMKIPHKNMSVYRFTPRMKQGQSLDSFVVKNNPLTLETASERIVFPQGKIFTPEKVLSKVGYWITTPEGFAPIITKK